MNPDKNNLSLIYEASMAQQRALMKEIQRRKAANEPAMTPAEREAFLNKREAYPIPDESWRFLGIVHAYTKGTGNINTANLNDWISICTSQVDIPIESTYNIIPTHTVQEVLDNYLLDAFGTKTSQLITQHSFYRDKLAGANRGVYIRTNEIVPESDDIRMESDPTSDVPLHRTLWYYNPNAQKNAEYRRPDAFRVIVDSVYKISDNNDYINKVGVVMTGLFFEAKCKYIDQLKAEALKSMTSIFMKSSNIITSHKDFHKDHEYR